MRRFTKTGLVVLASAAALCVAGTGGRAATNDTQSVTIDFSSSTGSPPQDYGSSLLHGINPDYPDAANMAPLNVYEWRLGDPGYISTSAVPPYDYFHVYSTVNRWQPHEVEAIASDFTQDPTYSGLTWNARCQALASRAAGLGQHPDWDLLNEPDASSWTWLSTGTTDWDNCYAGIRSGDSTARIAGPSISSPNMTSVETFLLDQKAKGKLPDIVTWHFSAPENVESDVSTIRSFMSSNGISARPIVIQEVMFSGSVPHPGQAVDYFAAAERAGVAIGHACWSETAPPNNNTCEQPMLDGILDNNENRRGQWYAYADYAAMTGNMVSTTTSNKSDVDGLASASSSSATALIGANDNWVGGSVSLTLSGLGSLSFLSGSSGSVRVAVQSIPQGMSPASQTLVSDSTYSYSGGSLSLTVSIPQYDAVRLTILPTSDDIVDSNWDSRGGILTDSPAITSTGTNNLDAFARGQDDALWETVYNGSSWSGWTGLGGPTSGTFVGAPAAVAWGSNITVAVRGTDNALWIRTYNGSSWGSWTSLGGTLTSSPTISSQNSSELDVFIRSTDDGLWQRSYNGSSWTSWTSLGGPNSGTFLDDPAAHSRSNGVITVYVEGTDHSLYERFWISGTGWSSFWANIGGTLTSSPAVSSETSSDESVFSRGANGQLQRDTWSGSWSGWTSLGGPTSHVITGTPSAVSWGSGRTDVVAWSLDGPLYHLATS